MLWVGRIGMARIGSLVGLSLLAACGGGGGGGSAGGSSPSPSPALFTVGGTVGGLTGSGLVLQNNAGDDLPVAASGAFVFATALAGGAGYAVTVRTQPSGQTCSVTNGSGTIGAAAVTGVVVSCAATATTPPPAPVLTLTPLRGSVFRFGWADVAGETGYRLQEDPDGRSGFGTVATLPADTAGHDLTVALLDRLAARYRLQACNAAGCADSNVVDAAAVATAAVGFVKATNTGISDQFGTSVALAADGSTLVVGAPYEDSNATGVGGAQGNNSTSNSGAAYVYVRSGGNWVAQAYLKASNTGLNDHFGWRVALSADGSTLAVSAVDEDSAARGVNGDQASGAAPDSGAVYVFVRSGGVWSQQAYLKASNTVGGAAFGSSVALSADGSLLAVGAFNEFSSATGIDGDQNNTSAAGSGAVYLFARSGATWSQQAYVKASNTFANDGFGYSVALAADGTTLAVGAPGEHCACSGIDPAPINRLANAAGAVYLFTRSAGAWSQQAYLKASNAEADDNFGWSVALSTDGNTLAVGAPGESSSAGGVNGDQGSNASLRSGATYLFGRSGGRWAQQAYLKAASPGPGDHFGWAVTLGGDGARLAVSALYEDSSASGIGGDAGNDAAIESGAVYVFKSGGAGWAQQAYLKPLSTDAGDAFGLSLSMSADAGLLAIGTPGDDSGGEPTDNHVDFSGAVHVY